MFEAVIVAMHGVLKGHEKHINECTTSQWFGLVQLRPMRDRSIDMFVALYICVCKCV